MPKDFRLKLSNGFEIAGQSYIHVPLSQMGATGNGNSSTTKRLLLIHGNQDNCRSFHLLAPALQDHYESKEEPCEIVAIDLPSHGRSDHKGSTIVVVDYVYYIAEVVRELGWEGLPIAAVIGHSMGCMVCSAYAAAFPQHVQGLVFLEGTGPLHRHSAVDLPRQIHAHVTARIKGPPPASASYENMETMVQIRQLTAKQAPGGNQYISPEAARELVTWGTKETEDGKFQWLFDPSLHYPHLMYLSLDQVVAISQSITCPVCFLVAEDGWPIEDKAKYDAIVGALQPTVTKTLPGSHSFHSDPQHALGVITEVLRFLDTDHPVKIAKKPISGSSATTTRVQTLPTAPPSSTSTAGCCIIL